MTRALAIALILAVSPAASWAQVACCCAALTQVRPCCAGAEAVGPDAAAAAYRDDETDSASDRDGRLERACPKDCARRTAGLDADEPLRRLQLEVHPPCAVPLPAPQLATLLTSVPRAATAARGPPTTGARRRALLQIWTC